LDDFIARVGMLPRSTAGRQEAFGSEPDPKMVPFMAQLLAQEPTNEVYGLAMAFEHKDWQAADAMPWVDRKSWPKQVKLDYDYHDPKWEWYIGPKTSRSFYVSEPYFDEGGSEITMVTLSVPMFDATSNFFGVAPICEQVSAKRWKESPAVEICGAISRLGFASETIRRIVSFAGLLPLARMPNDN
jgi:hypothetical protein